MKVRIRSFIVWGSVALFLYGSAYGIARWRKFLVMYETRVKEQHLLVRWVGPGLDIRETWRGRFKNRVNPTVFLVFRPVEFVENCVRGGRRPRLRTSRQLMLVEGHFAFSASAVQHGRADC
jgi:hypothetical protein